MTEQTQQTQQSQRSRQIPSSDPNRPDEQVRPSQRTPPGETEERRIGGMTIRIDRLLCVGFGDCIELAPDLFEFDDEGIAVFREGAEQEARSVVLEACECCPVDALTVLDEDGRQLVP